MTLPNLKTELKSLIEKSPSLDEKEREEYLESLDTLEGTQTEELFKIFQDEQFQLEKISGKEKQDELELRKKHLEDLKKFLPKETKTITSNYEKEEKTEAEKLLNQNLNDL